MTAGGGVPPHALSIITPVLLIVNYHYIVRERQHEPRAVFPVTVAELEAQVDELARSFELVTRDAVVAAVTAGAPLPDRACLLTFDDGLREQVELALPVLEHRGVSALFFVCGVPLAERRVLYVHKVHLLRELMDDVELLAALGLDPDAGAAGVEAARAMYRYDTPGAAMVKYLLNVVLGPIASGPVDALFAKWFDEAEVCDRLYASRGDIAELEARASLGAHAYTHRPLAVLDRAELRRDLDRGAEVLEAIAGRRPRVLSYPYGTEAAVDAVVAQEAAAAGFVVGMTLERALNATLEEPLLLARLDTNDAPGGRAPLFSITGDRLVVRHGLAASRTRYVLETVA